MNNYRLDKKSNLCIFNDFSEFLKNGKKYRLISEEEIKTIELQTLLKFIDRRKGIENTNFIALSNVESEDDFTHTDFMKKDTSEQLNYIFDFIDGYDLLENIIEENDISEEDKIELVDDFIQIGSKLFKK